jgi:hypothetical protein
MCDVVDDTDVASLCSLDLEKEVVRSPFGFTFVFPAAITADVDEETGTTEPSPLTAQLTSMPRLIDQSQVKTKRGVLMRTFSTGKISGKRAGGGTMNSTKCRIMQAA